MLYLLQVPSSLTLLQSEKELRSRVDLLNKEKQDRLRQLKQRTKVDEQLSGELGLTAFFISQTAVPSEQQLTSLEQHIQELQQEKVTYSYFQLFHHILLSCLGYD